jgi:selenium metabolism protein YedF
MSDGATTRRDGGTIVVLNADSMGRGNDALGAKLLGNFLRTLTTVEMKPDAIVFYNAAVKLLGPDSALLEPLRQLEDAGVDLLACLTCVEFYALTGNIAVGHVNNMREIVQRTMTAEKVVTI